MSSGVTNLDRSKTEEEFEKMRQFRFRFRSTPLMRHQSIATTRYKLSFSMTLLYRGNPLHSRTVLLDT